MNSVLLDTSFLISLSDPNRPHHATAEAYYRECVHRQVIMYLSTVVVSEFAVRQSINDLPLSNFVVLPFNVDHAVRCGMLINQMSKDTDDDRVRVKDDFKLLAQCACESISHLIGEDGSTLAKYLERARDEFSLATKAILLRDGFDQALFGNGQTQLFPVASN